jgi:uncharacterized protein (TIGR02453 family)
MDNKRYFAPEALEFLKELRLHNERDWFLSNKARYEREVRDPFLRLIGDLAPVLKKISPYFLVDPRPVGGSMMRIYRDTRFSPDKRPYKTSVAAHFKHGKADGVGAPAFYLHFEPGESAVGGGVWRPDSETLAKIRRAIVADSKGWKRVTSRANFGSSCGMIGESLKRPPSGFDSKHPLIEDIKRKDFAITVAVSDDQVCGADLFSTITEALRGTAPFVHFLREAVGLP